MQDKQKYISEICCLLGVSDLQLEEELLESRINSTKEFIFDSSVDSLLHSKLDHVYMDVEQRFGHVPMGWKK